MKNWKIEQGSCFDILPTLSPQSIKSIITSPPYYQLRDYHNSVDSMEEKTGKNRRSVWSINKANFKESHFATMPEKLAELMILASTNPGDKVLDPFSGAATTGLVALQHQRSYLGIEVNPEYIDISINRIKEKLGFFA